MIKNEINLFTYTVTHDCCLRFNALCVQKKRYIGKNSVCYGTDTYPTLPKDCNTVPHKSPLRQLPFHSLSASRAHCAGSLSHVTCNHFNDLAHCAKRYRTLYHSQIIYKTYRTPLWKSSLVKNNLSGMAWRKKWAVYATYQLINLSHLWNKTKYLLQTLWMSSSDSEILFKKNEAEKFDLHTFFRVNMAAVVSLKRVTIY